MSINTHILLPVEARAEDIAQVMGILAGLTPVKRPIGSGDSWSCEVEGATVHPSSGQFNCANIRLEAPRGAKLIDGEKHHSCFAIAASHSGMYQGSATKCGFWISTSVSPFWEAVARGLVDFFGGEMDRNDCDDIDVDYAMPKAPDIMACDGDAWHAFQQRKMDVKPVALPRGKAA